MSRYASTALVALALFLLVYPPWIRDFGEVEAAAGFGLITRKGEVERVDDSAVPALSENPKFEEVLERSRARGAAPRTWAYYRVDGTLLLTLEIGLLGAALILRLGGRSSG